MNWYLPRRFDIKNTVRQCPQCAWLIIILIVSTVIDAVMKCFLADPVYDQTLRLSCSGLWGQFSETMREGGLETPGRQGSSWICERCCLCRTKTNPQNPARKR